jgi:hypothetical protein
MARRLQKQTWVELRRLFVSGWSLGKLAKRFSVPKGTIAARCAREKWARERIEGQTLQDNQITLSDDPRLAEIQALVRDCKLAALEAEAKTAKALALKAAKAVETIEINSLDGIIRPKRIAATCGRASHPQSSQPWMPRNAGNDLLSQTKQRSTSNSSKRSCEAHRRSALAPGRITARSPQWFKAKVLADIAAEERRDDEDTPRAGFSAYTLACLESELGIM